MHKNISEIIQLFLVLFFPEDPNVSTNFNLYSLKSMEASMASRVVPG